MRNPTLKATMTTTPVKNPARTRATNHVWGVSRASDQSRKTLETNQIVTPAVTQMAIKARSPAPPKKGETIHLPACFSHRVFSSLLVRLAICPRSLQPGLLILSLRWSPSTSLTVVLLDARSTKALKNLSQEASKDGHDAHDPHIE